jgi:uncharacterized coiled-coil DUF342 family protein
MDDDDEDCEGGPGLDRLFAEISGLKQQRARLFAEISSLRKYCNGLMVALHTVRAQRDEAAAEAARMHRRVDELSAQAPWHLPPTDPIPYRQHAS